MISKIFHPFDSKKLNSFEFLSFLIQAVTCCIAYMYFMLDNYESNGFLQGFLIYALLAINIFFLVKWIYMYWEFKAKKIMVVLMTNFRLILAKYKKVFDKKESEANLESNLPLSPSQSPLIRIEFEQSRLDDKINVTKK